MAYTVLVDDNFHYADEDERTEHGTYETADAAIEAARTIVLESLRSVYEPGMSAEALYEKYQSFGDDPFVVGPEPRPEFSAWAYARSMAATIVGEQEDAG